MTLPVHRVEWTVNASGISDIEVICDALAWLIGDENVVQIEKTQSFHGSDIYLIRANADKKSAARKSLPRLGSSLLGQLQNEVINRIDSENWLHLRINLNELVCGNLVLVNPKELSENVKGRIKLELYPGDDKEKVAVKLLSEAADIAKRNNLPEPVKRLQ